VQGEGRKKLLGSSGFFVRSPRMYTSRGERKKDNIMSQEHDPKPPNTIELIRRKQKRTEKKRGTTCNKKVITEIFFLVDVIR